MTPQVKKKQDFAAVVEAIKVVLYHNKVGKKTEATPEIFDAAVVLKTPHDIQPWMSIRTLIRRMEITVNSETLRSTPPHTKGRHKFLDHINDGTRFGTPVDYGSDEEGPGELGERITKHTQEDPGSGSDRGGNLLFTPVGGTPTEIANQYHLHCLDVLEYLRDNLRFDKM